MRLTLTNNWKKITKDYCSLDLFTIGWTYKRQWALNVLGFMFFGKENEDPIENDENSVFYHVIDGHFYGKYDGTNKFKLEEDYMFSIDLLGFGIIITWGKDSED